MSQHHSKTTILTEFAVLGLFSVTCGLFLWPASVQLGESILGGDFMYATVWTFDAVSRGLLERGEIPFETRMLNYPDGGSLEFVGWSFIGLITALRGLGVPLVPSTNLSLALHLIFACYFTYRLALRLTGKRAESVVGGLAFGLCPYVLSLVWNGQIEKLSHGFLPVIVLCVIGIVADRRYGFLPWLGLAIGLLFATSPYNTLFAAFLAIVTTAGMLSRARAGQRAKVFGRAVLAAGVCFLSCLPYVYYWKRALAADLDSLYAPAAVPLLPGTLPNGALQNATVLGWFAPGKAAGVLGSTLEHPVLHIHYLGWGCLAFAFAGLVLVRLRHRQARTGISEVIVGTALVAFVIAHGYCLVVSPTHSPGTEYNTPLPLYFAYKLLPAVGRCTVTVHAGIS
jgi:hypothetical protein